MSEKTVEKKIANNNLEWQRDKDREKVKGIFRFYEVPGGLLSFCFKAYKGDDVMRFDLQDETTYELPLGVARHLNKNGWYPVHAFRKDEMGNPYPDVGKKVRRFGFQSLEFTELEDLADRGELLITEPSYVLR